MLDKRVLVVDTASPETITQKIRKSLVIDRDDGSKAVAVHWGYNEACQLTEIIDDVPSPILRDYAWSSNLPPFEHQKTTASECQHGRRIPMRLRLAGGKVPHQPLR